MKFLTTHRKDLLKVMSEKEISPDQFDYAKRKGRVQIIEPTSGKIFSYFRRKETQIHPETKQWVELESFEVRLGNEPLIQLEHWKAVVDKFRVWLESL